VAKLYAYWITVNYREAYNIYACNGILFNHESPVRGETFVTRKITRGLARIKMGLEKCLYLGNLNAKRDWGHARDYVEMQWLMLQQEEPEDFVIATGEQHTVKEFVEIAALEMGMKIQWRGTGPDERGFTPEGRCVVSVDTKYFRPTEGEARTKRGWKPTTSFDDLVNEMVDADLKAAERDRLVKDNGFKVYQGHA
jgi:GDPmannose 4,6-dehydratase